MSSPGHRLLSLWNRLAPLPGGAWLYSRLFGRMVPYSGSVRPRFRVIEPGHVVVEIPDRRANRNHLRSVHAVALVNVAEMASGVAMLCAVPPDVRAIVVRIQIEYLKKARGTLVAEARCSVPDVLDDANHDFESEVRDAQGAVVARAIVTWRMGRVRA